MCCRSVVLRVTLVAGLVPVVVHVAGLVPSSSSCVPGRALGRLASSTFTTAWRATLTVVPGASSSSSVVVADGDHGAVDARAEHHLGAGSPIEDWVAPGPADGAAAGRTIRNQKTSAIRTNGRKPARSFTKKHLRYGVRARQRAESLDRGSSVTGVAPADRPAVASRASRFGHSSASNRLRLRRGRRRALPNGAVAGAASPRCSQAAGGGDPAARRAGQEAAADQERLGDLLDGLALLADGDRQGGEPDRAAAEAAAERRRARPGRAGRGPSSSTS